MYVKYNIVFFFFFKWHKNLTFLEYQLEDFLMKGKAYLGSQLHSILPSSFLPSARVTSLPTKQIKLLEACHDRYTTAEMEHNQKKNFFCFNKDVLT